jgi:hypothetical protein
MSHVLNREVLLIFRVKNYLKIVYVDSYEGSIECPKASTFCRFYKTSQNHNVQIIFYEENLFIKSN